MARGVTVEDMANEFISEKVRYRGKTYVITELSMKAYDKTIRQATEVDEDTKDEKFNPQAHNKLLMGACVTVDGEKVDVDEVYTRGTRLVRALQGKIQKVHFDDEPEEDVEDEETETPGEAKADAKASA